MIAISTERTSFCTADVRSALAYFVSLSASGERPRIRLVDRPVAVHELRARAEAYLLG